MEGLSKQRKRTDRHRRIFWIKVTMEKQELYPIWIWKPKTTI